MSDAVATIIKKIAVCPECHVFNVTPTLIIPVIGRKAWLFSGSPRGARASAILYSLIETAKANDLEPKAYLNYLFERLPLAKTERAIIK